VFVKLDKSLRECNRDSFIIPTVTHRYNLGEWRVNTKST